MSSAAHTSTGSAPVSASAVASTHNPARTHALVFAIMVVILVGAPLLGVYPVFMMKVMCFALFACAFNLLLGFAGLLSFGHALFFASAGYAAGHSIKVWGFPPELGIVFAIAVSAAIGWVGSAPSGPQLPATVVDATGKSVTVKDVSRIVSIFGSTGASGVSRLISLPSSGNMPANRSPFSTFSMCAGFGGLPNRPRLKRTVE
mgnify:CR=1 FL=1